LTGRAPNRYNAWAAIRKRAKAAGFLTPVGCHTWRATGITILPGKRRAARARQQMAGHESPRTTKLYDRTKDEITLSRGGANPVVMFDPKAAQPRNARRRYAFDADYGARRTFEFRTKRRCIGSPPPPPLAHCYDDPNPAPRKKKQRVDRMESNPGL
jgi:hypothetical protein